jgi:hypothetical protein
MILLEKVIVAQLVKKYIVFNGTRRFITVSQEPATVAYLGLKWSLKLCDLSYAKPN